MLAVLLSSLLFGLLFLSFGILVKKWFNISFIRVEIILLGMVVTNALTSGVSLFHKIDYLILLILIIVAICILVRLHHEMKIFFTIKINVVHFGFIGFAILALIKSASLPGLYDTGLYHVQSIKWIQEYSAIPGLANLHSRLGFTRNIFTLHALGSLKFLFRQPVFSLNFLCFLLIGGYLYNRAYEVFRIYGFGTFFAFHSILFFYLLRLSYINVPSPDFLTTILPIFIFVRLWEISRDHDETDFDFLFPIMILSVYIVTIKLSALPFLILPSALLVKIKKWLIDKFIKYILILIVLLTPWLVGNIVTTGWVLFPSTNLDFFNFDWKVPDKLAFDAIVGIKGWARDPGPNYLIAASMKWNEWLPLWWGKLNNQVKALLVISLLSFIFINFLYIFRKLKLKYAEKCILYVIPIGIAYWLTTAPSFRFGAPYLYLGITIIMAYCGNYQFRLGQKLIYFFMISFLLIIYDIYINVKPLNEFYNKGINISMLVLQENMNKPKGLFFKPLNLGNTVIYIPSSGDRCFDFDFPCCPSLQKGLTLRGADIRYGFKINHK